MKDKEIRTNLTLNLKGKYYDMIESGFKTEEYREIKPYWLKRLTSVDRINIEEETKLCNNPYLILKECYFKKYETVTFVYGYTKKKMTFKINDITINTGDIRWGAVEDKPYFIIKIGERIK